MIKPFCKFAALVVLGVQAGVLAGGPITPPIVNPANNHTYRLLSSASWADSAMDAIRLGGYLATINNAAEQNWVYQTFGRHGGVSRLLWIGLNDAQHEGQYAWQSGESASYRNWAPGEPNNSQSGEDYIAMYYPGHSAQGRWNDWAHRSSDPIGIPFNGVVEIDPTGLAPSILVETDTTWLGLAPEGNRESRPISTVGRGYELANPTWNSALDFDTSGWAPVVMRGAGIWTANGATPLYLRKTFTLDQPVEDARLIVAVDDDALVYINGAAIVYDASGGASGLGPLDVTDYLVAGENLIAVKAHDSYGGSESFRLQLSGTYVPEPSSWLVLIGLGAWAGLRRR